MTLKFIIDTSEFEVDAVIFDKDGTLNDSISVMPEIAKRRVAEIKKIFPEAKGLEMQLSKTIGLQNDGTIDRYSPMMIGSRIETTTAAAVALYVSGCAKWSNAVSLAWEAFMKADSSLNAEQKVLLLPGVFDLIKEVNCLAGKVAIATNDVRASIDKFLYLSDLKKYVHAVACSDEVNSGKPAPDLVFLAAKRLKVLPQRCLIVGDSTLDIEMGFAAGVKKTVGVLTGSSSHSDFIGKADFVVRDIRSIRVLQG